MGWWLAAAAWAAEPESAAADPAAAGDVAPETAPPAWRRSVGGHGSEVLRIRWYDSPDSLQDRVADPILEAELAESVLDYVEVVNRINLAGGSQAVTLSLQLDAVTLLSNAYKLDGALVQERDLLQPELSSFSPNALISLEKVSLEARPGPARVVVGDGYVALGRGLALNVVKNTDIDIDTSLLGLQGTVQLGDWELLAAGGLTNPQQVALENPNFSLAANDGHAVSALRVARYALGPANLSAHGALFQLADQTGLSPSHYSAPLSAASAGGAVELMGVGGFDVYLEGDGFFYQDPDIPVKQGYAVYSSITTWRGPLSILVEGKRYKDTERINVASFTGGRYEFTAGPTLEYERVITEDSAAAVNSNNIYGGRAKVDVTLPGATLTVPSLALGVFRDEETAASGGLHFNQTPETILHPVAGFQWTGGPTHILANAGYRQDIRDSDYGSDRLEHLDVAFATPILGHELELAINSSAFQWGKNLAGQVASAQHDFVDLSGSITASILEPLALVLYSDYSSNPLVTSEGNLAEDFYGAVELQFRPWPSGVIKAFYGAYRAGIRCAGGQCRNLPGFDGARVTFDSTF